jgi:excinuclease ABC subunit C
MLPENQSDLPLGADAIRAALATMPTAPGIYRMLNIAGDILYIGKAKNLKNRVSNYTQPNNYRIMRMVEQVARVDIVTCGSEAEALLLESNLVKRHNPRYNILLKDDKSFPYLFIAADHPFPRIAKHRGAQTAKGEYFGPFASVNALNQTLALLQRIFLLRPCADSIFANRSRPCLQYQIKRCSAPCVGYVDREQYAAQLTIARDFLRGKHRQVQEHLVGEMQTASAAQDYETAALLRDRIHALTQVQQEQRLNAVGLDDADVIALARHGARSVVQVFFYRQGNHFGHQSFHPRHDAEDADAEVMASFLGLFYQSHTPPPEILVNIEPTEIELIEEALSLSAKQKITLRVPLRGDKRSLVEHASSNADAALSREELERASVRQHLERLRELFALPAAPARIEVYDNSHIMGTHAIGAMIVATPDGFDKRSYRSFNIKDATPGDDYGMMREVFRRRFKKVIRVESRESSEACSVVPSPLRGGLGRGALNEVHHLEAPPPTSPARGEALLVASPSLDSRLSTLITPDLVLIDGGAGQLSAVMEVMAELELTDVPLVAIAKGADRNAGREWFFMPGKSPFQLPPNDPALHYLQRLRDEAHRFAIGNHRQRRATSLTTSALDDIPSIGATRKRALLHHFGSRAAVERATLDELQRVTGISQKTAQVIFDYFHGK